MHRVLLAVFVALYSAAPVHAQDDWDSIRKEYEKLFTPLPTKRIFSDLEKELRLCRRDPGGDRSRAEIAKRRNDLDTRRAAVIANRSLRNELVSKIARVSNERAEALLMDAYGRVTADIERARKVYDRHVQMLRLDINPGVDPGGIYWKNWARGEMSAARRVLSDEEALRDGILRALRGGTTSELRHWLARGADSEDEAERRRMLEALARSHDPECQAELIGRFRGARSGGERAFLTRVLGKSRDPVAAAALREALSDPEWGVRACAIAGLRWFGWETYKHPWGLRDAITVEALILTLAREPGRLRLEARDALVVATGHVEGIDAKAWSAWWEGVKANWKPRAKAADLKPVSPGSVSRFFGIPTTSKRVVFLISRGVVMEKPLRRREKANDGSPAPEPKIDTRYRIAAWELEEALTTFPEDALFTVIVYGERPHVWSKKLKPAKKTNRVSAAKFVRKYRPGGPADPGTALLAALRIGAPGGGKDLRVGGEESADTLFIVGGSHNRDGMAETGGLVATMKRVTAYRPIRLHAVGVEGARGYLKDAAVATGGTCRVPGAK